MAVWVLCGRRGIESVSVLRSGSRGKLDGEGEGARAEIRNVKACGVGCPSLGLPLLEYMC